MKKIYLFSLIVLLQFTAAHAQDIAWTYHSDHHDGNNEDKAYAITEVKGGGYVFVGKYGVNGTGNADILITKLGSDGHMVWTKTYGDSLGDEARSIKELADGSFIISGFTFALGDTINPTSYKSMLMKIDSNGDTLWTKRYTNPGVALGDGMGSGVDTTDDGGFVMVGKYANGSNDNDFFIVKTDANGDSIYTRLYGGDSTDVPRSVRLTSDGGFIIAGFTRSYGSNKVKGNMWLVKTNSDGDTLWTKAIGTANEEDCFSVRQTDDGGYILAGRTGDNAVYQSELYAVKTDAQGNVSWSKTFGNPSENDFGRDIVQTPDKGYALIGARVATHGYSFLFPQLVYVVKMDSAGLFEWDREFGYDNTPNGANGLCIANTSDGGLIAGGYDQPNSPFGGEDLRAFIIKFSSLALATGMQKEATHQCLVYPNPFSETATVSIPSGINGAGVFEIFNVAGQIIASRNVEENMHHISISKRDLSSGMYFYRLYSPKGDVNYRGKFIVK